MTDQAIYKRILLKLSGEVLMGKKSYGMDLDAVSRFADEIKGVMDLGVEMGVVVGGGNIFRGFEGSMKGIDQTSADYMGMLATLINSLALQSALEQIGVVTRVQSAIEMREVAEPFIVRRAVRHLEKGRVVIFAAGTGNPYFTTDTAASLRAAEIKADVILKVTTVDGVYDKDPAKHRDAKMFKEISYNTILTEHLKIMDATAVSLCRENSIPIIVFNLQKAGNIKRVICGKAIGTKVKG